MNGYINNSWHTTVSATPDPGWNDITSYTITAGMWFSTAQSNQISHTAISPASGAASGVLLSQINFVFGENCGLTSLQLGYIQACCNFPASSGWGTDSSIFASAVAQVVSPSGVQRGAIGRVNASGCYISNAPLIGLIPTKVGLNASLGIQVMAGDMLSLELGYVVNNISTSGSAYSVTFGFDDLSTVPLAGTGCTAAITGSSIATMGVFSFVTLGTLAIGHVGKSYALGILTQSIPSITTPPTYALAPGSNALPSWLSLSSAGFLTGTPVQAETDIFTVRCTDTGGLYTDRTFTLQVTA